MNTIDNIMALHDEAAEKRHINGAPVYNAVAAHAREALRAALTEAYKEAFARGMAVRPASAALAKDASLICEGTKAQPVREPLQDSLAWELWLNAVDTANNTGRLVAYTYKEAIERAHNIRGEN